MCVFCLCKMARICLDFVVLDFLKVIESLLMKKGKLSEDDSQRLDWLMVTF